MFFLNIILIHGLSPSLFDKLEFQSKEYDLIVSISKFVCVQFVKNIKSLLADENRCQKKSMKAFMCSIIEGSRVNNICLYTCHRFSFFQHSDRLNGISHHFSIKLSN